MYFTTNRRRVTAILRRCERGQGQDRVDYQERQGDDEDAGPARSVVRPEQEVSRCAGRGTDCPQRKIQRSG